MKMNLHLIFTTQNARVPLATRDTRVCRHARVRQGTPCYLGIQSNQKNMKTLAQFLQNPTEFFKDERRMRILIISLFVTLFLCLIFAMIRSAKARGTSTDDNEPETVNVVTVSETPSVTTTPVNTPTAWWLQPVASSTPQVTPADTTSTTSDLAGCQAYTSQEHFTPGTFAYVSLLPPFENLIRSGAGKMHPIVGYVDIGNWVKVIESPVICNDGYVWILVESEGNPRGWTAGGHNYIQWLVPCPNNGQKCRYNKPSPDVASTKPSTGEQGTEQCKSDKLMAGIDAQVNPDALLVIRDKANGDKVIGRAAPGSIVMILNGPECAGGASWWSIFSDDAQIAGWSVDADLRACPKEGECTPWDS